MAAATLCVVFSSAAAQENDKLLHISVRAIIGTGVVNTFPQLSAQQQIALTLVPGVLKEIYDSKQSGNYFSSEDMLANLVGAALGVYGSRWRIESKNENVVVRYNIRF